MRVSGWAADEGACGFYRIERPFAALGALGVECSVEHGSVHGQSILDAGTTLVVAQRVAHPDVVILLDALKRSGVPYVYEIDDLLLNLDPENPVRAAYDHPLVRDTIEAGITNAAAITVSTPELGEALEHLNPEIWVLPNCLPDYWLDFERPERDGPVAISWAGSSTHRGDMHKDVQYGLRKALQQTDAVFVCQGHDYRRELRVEGEFVAWSPSIPDFHRTLLNYDIGLCPLRPTAFNRCKSELKAMEYQAAGVVPVAQDTPAYRRVITDGVDGFLCRTQDQWLRRIRDLVLDHDMRAEMSAAAMAHTPARTYSANAFRWRRVYERFSA